jgi:GMP synthase-like glutamine amidotransferase
VKVLVLRHHLEDDPGLIGEALVARGATLKIHLVPDDGPIPFLDGFDLGIVLGAKWSVYDRETVGGWIDEELDWLRRADQLGVPILGICFGAQAISTALGGGVERAPAQEIGWIEIDSSVPMISNGPWFQFHGDRCLPPEDAEILARNALCVQAFRVRRTIAVQFHPEVDRRQLQGWVDTGADVEMREEGLDVDVVLQETEDRLPEAKANVEAFIEFLLEGSDLASSDLDTPRAVPASQ